MWTETTLFLRFIPLFQGTGIWQANFGFSCQNPCPEPYNLNKKKYVIVRHEWETGFELLIKFTPVIDLNDWTMVFTFLDEPGANVQFHAWEAQLTVSGYVHKISSHWAIRVENTKFAEKVPRVSIFEFLFLRTTLS